MALRHGVQEALDRTNCHYSSRHRDASSIKAFHRCVIVEILLDSSAQTVFTSNGINLMHVSFGQRKITSETKKWVDEQRRRLKRTRALGDGKTFHKLPL